MEILKQNQQEIVVGTRPSSMTGKIITLFSSVVLLSIPGVIGLTSGIPRIFSDMGITKLTCDRITLTQVNCQLSTSHYFGLRTTPVKVTTCTTGDVQGFERSPSKLDNSELAST